MNEQSSKTFAELSSAPPRKCETLRPVSRETVLASEGDRSGRVSARLCYRLQVSQGEGDAKDSLFGHPNDRTPELSSDGVETRWLKERVRGGLFAQPTSEGSVRAGRFVLLERLGSGGMGSVFRAYDPELDRSVAVKILHRSSDDPGHSEALASEARALARLMHPNVVVIHDVSTAQNQTFVAMEYVEGENLAAWCRHHPEDDEQRFDRALELLIDAGKGLSAAHAVGLVHRDFKPANVLVGRDGRARVADFGLARAHSTVELKADPDDRETEVTEGLVGTPAYMAPEQRRGEAIDARADQFSFCVTAWEVLFGHRPTSHRPEMPSRGVRRRWVAGVLLRGLADDPEERYPTMAPLLAALERNPRVRRRRTLAGMAVLLSAAASLGGYRLYRGSLCDDAGASIEQLWNEEQRERLEAAFRGADIPGEARVWEHTMPLLDARAQALQRAYVDVCEARLEAAPRFHPDFDARTRCLQGVELEFGAVMRALTQLDREVALGAPVAVSGMASPRPCLDWSVERLETAGFSRRLQEDDVRLAHAVMNSHVGRHQQAREALGALIGSGFAGDPHGKALALAALGKTLLELSDYEEAFATLEQAYWLGLRNGADAVATHAARLMVGPLAQKGRVEEAQRWLEAAEATFDRAQLGRQAEIDLTNSRAQLAHHIGELERAEALTRDALRLAIEHWGSEHFETASAYHNLAVVLQDRGESAEAIDVAGKELEIRSRFFGEVHPQVAASHAALGAAMGRAGRFEEAAEHFELAADIYEQAYADVHADRGMALSNLGVSLNALGRSDAALEAFRKAATIYEQTLGPDDMRSISVRLNVAIADAEAGACERALPSLKDARDRFAEAAPSHPRNGQIAQVLAWCQARLGRWEEARVAFEHALEAYAELPSARASLMVHWSEALRHRGELEQAEAKSRRALELLEGGDDPGIVAPDAHAEHAVVSWALGERARATEHSELAIRRAREAGGPPLELALHLSERARFSLVAGDEEAAVRAANEASTLFEQQTGKPQLSTTKLVEFHSNLAEVYAANESERARRHVQDARTLLGETDASTAAQRERLDGIEAKL